MSPPTPHHDEQPDGLRERKKLATRRALQRAALALAATEGPDTTVERICEQADVSPRTFFNYFSSKEEALVGRPPAPPTDEQLAAFEAGGPTGDLVQDLRAVLVEHLRTAVPTPREMELRRRVLLDHPELLVHHHHGFVEIEHRLALAAARRMDVAPDDDRARVVGAVAVALMRLTVRRWLQDGDTELPEHAAAVLAALHTIR